MPPPPKVKDTSDTPWPLPLRIAGYVAVVLSVPYCGAHVVASSPSVRDWLEGDRPDLADDRAYGKRIVAFVRKYWGESEGLPYADRLVLEEAEHDGPATDATASATIEDWTVLEAEPGHDERLAQGQIEALKHRPVPVRATMVPAESTGSEYGLNGSDDTTAWRGRVDGSVAADRASLVAALGRSGWDGAKRDVTQVQQDGGSNSSNSGDISNVGFAAVDFDDDDSSSSSSSSSSDNHTTTANSTATSAASPDDGIKTDEEMVAFESSGYQIGSDADEVTHLKRLTTTWSAWHHESSWSDGSNEQQQQQQQKQKQQSSSQSRLFSSSSSTPASSSSDSSRNNGADALQIATLEHQIAQLQSDLKDPMCTRDIDDMERELRETRNELWRIKGGWGGKIRSALRL